MSIEIRLDEWAPLDGSLPTEPNDDTVYVVPTRPIIDGKIDKYPLYTDHVRYLPKAARAESAPVTFSIPEGGRNFISGRLSEQHQHCLSRHTQQSEQQCQT